MTSPLPQYRAQDIAITMMSYSDRSWKIDLVVTHLPGGHVTRMPVLSGEPNQPLKNSQWTELLDIVRELLTCGIADVIEPM